MKDVTEKDYAQVWNWLKTLFPNNSYPNVFMIDHEITSTTENELEFPKVKRLLCKFHIDKCLVANSKKYLMEV